MPLKLTITLIITLIATLGFSRSNFLPTGAKPQGMGNAFVSQFDVFSVYHNEAGLANLDHASVSFFYENLFFEKQMSVSAGIVSFATKSGNFAFQYNSFGPAQWHESNGGIAYGRHLSKKLSIGIELCYYGIKLPEQNKTLNTYSFEFGAIYQLSDKTFLGAHIANPYSTTANTLIYQEQIPWRINFGGHTLFTEKFILSYEASMKKETETSLRLGAQWEAAENIFIRGGINTQPSQFFAGLGYHTNLFEFETAFSYHQYLGYTPSVSIIFSFL